MKKIQEGIRRGLLSIDDENRKVTYHHQNRTRNYQNPEEQVQAEIFCSLVIDYGYSAERIRMFEPVQMGRDTKYADMVVYADDKCLRPHIIVECKRQEVSEAEFQQGVEQAYSYAYALPGEVKYLIVTSGLKTERFKVDKSQKSRIQLTDIPKFGTDKVAACRYVFGADLVPDTNGRQVGLTVIDQADLTRRFKKAHEALWAGGQLNPSEAFDELDKLIFCKIRDEKKTRGIGEPYDFQIISVDDSVEPDPVKRRGMETDELYHRVLALYEEGRSVDAEVFRDGIRLSPEKVRTVVGYLEGIDLGNTDLDSKGRAFETFLGSLFRGRFGQYFTPRQIVEFIVDVLPITRDSKVLDTSCGSGGFLLYALNKIRTMANREYMGYVSNNDMRLYPFWYAYWHDFAANKLFGIEISEQISRAAKMNMIIHDDGHTNVVTADGLLSDDEIIELTGNKGFRYGTFDFIVTNPPFGSIVRQTERAYMKTYNLGKKEEDWLALAAKPETVRDSQSTEVLFIEQAHKYLRPGGMLAIVIPDGILTNSSLQYVRNRIEEWFRIVAVVSLPQTAFMANGAGVKSSVLFLKKWDSARTGSLQAKKREIRSELLTETKYRETCIAWEKEKKELQQRKATELKDKLNTSVTNAKKTEEYKSWNAEITAEYAARVSRLKNEISQRYQDLKKMRLPDYPIFMAIAENIGYDATGRTISKNDLVEIGRELKQFIAEQL